MRKLLCELKESEREALMSRVPSSANTSNRVKINRAPGSLEKVDSYVAASLPRSPPKIKGQGQPSTPDIHP